MPLTDKPKSDIPEMMKSRSFAFGKGRGKKHEMAVAAALEAQRGKGKKPKKKRPATRDDIKKAAIFRLAAR